MNNFALKTCARQTIHESKPGIISTGALYILLNLLVSTVSDYWLGLNHMTDSEFLNYIGKGNYEYARIYLENHLNTAPQALIGSVLINLVCIIVSYGFLSFLLKSVRRQPAQTGDLMNGFSMIPRIIVLEIVENVIISLWSLLFIIPGIIASYKYRLARYLLIDNPDMSPIECLRESRRLMNGHKAELFSLDLSFIGWILLASLGSIAAATQIWSVPYMETTFAYYYVLRTGGAHAVTQETQEDTYNE